MWLADLLPKYFPGARIATYAYASESLRYGKGTKTTLRECGMQLLNELKLEREANGVSFTSVRFSYDSSLTTLLNLDYGTTDHLHWPFHGRVGNKAGTNE